MKKDKKVEEIKEEKKTIDESAYYWMPIGMSLGLSIGAGIGAATNNIGLWIPVGMCLGMSIGIAIDESKKKKK